MLSQLFEWIHSFLFRLDEEKAHQVVIFLLKYLKYYPRQCVESNTDSITIMGLTFKNHLGLAAGFDKNGECIEGLIKLGFGHIEVGTVTPKPQKGNPLPRLFRLKKDRALINRMGFNNKGVHYLVNQLKKIDRKDCIIGINIGKNKDTPNDKSVDDYLYCLKAVYIYADYITVNISSPNTPNLRDLQHSDALEDLLSQIKETQGQLAQNYQKYVPIALKIAPDLSPEMVMMISEKVQKYKIDAVIATNTTIDKTNVLDTALANENGGLSGAPLFDKSNTIITMLKEKLPNNIPIIGVGGISSVQDCKMKQECGAQLVQIYTGFIYQGIALISSILKET